MSTRLLSILFCTPANLSDPPLRPKAPAFSPKPDGFCFPRASMSAIVQSPGGGVSSRAGLIWINVARGGQMAQNGHN
jgi:hypothetical protein